MNGSHKEAGPAAISVSSRLDGSNAPENGVHPDQVRGIDSAAPDQSLKDPTSPGTHKTEAIGSSRQTMTGSFGSLSQAAALPDRQGRRKPASDPRLFVFVEKGNHVKKQSLGGVIGFTPGSLFPE